MSQPDPRRESIPMTEKNFPMKTMTRYSLPLMSAEEIAKKVLPIFGGTAPTESSTATSASGENSETQNSEGTATSGGNTEKPKELSPEEISSLLEQVNETNTKLTEATKKLTEYEQKEQQSKRAQMGKEEALSADLEQAQQTIVKMDQALKNQAVINAINGFRDIEFHDTSFVLRELQASAPEVFEDMEVDLDGGTVTVKGVENHLRRIAKEKDWAVKKNSNITNNGRGGSNGAAVGRPSGSPPANPAPAGDKASRREALAKKFPVITHGRSL